MSDSLTPDNLQKMDAYWRAANYLSVGQMQSGTFGFAGEESAGATFLRRDGSVWTTDKDGIAAALLSAEITARTGRDPGQS